VEDFSPQWTWFTEALLRDHHYTYLTINAGKLGVSRHSTKPRSVLFLRIEKGK